MSTPSARNWPHRQVPVPLPVQGISTLVEGFREVASGRTGVGGRSDCLPACGPSVACPVRETPGVLPLLGWRTPVVRRGRASLGGPGERRAERHSGRRATGILSVRESGRFRCGTTFRLRRLLSILFCRVSRVAGRSCDFPPESCWFSRVDRQTNSFRSSRCLSLVESPDSVARLIFRFRHVWCLRSSAHGNRSQGSLAAFATDRRLTTSGGWLSL